MQTGPSGRLAIGSLPLALGGELPEVTLAYVCHGTLNARGDNAVLVTHGLTSGHGMLDAAGSSEGSWADLLRPGRALDTARYFVVCSNAVGSAFGSTGPTSPRPGGGPPWGAEFPPLTVRDMVLAQQRLLQRLGVTHLQLVIGPSFGGMQALQWALDHPDWVSAAASVVSGLHWPNDQSSAALLQRFEADPAWQGGRYRVGQDMRGCMERLRVDTLRSYGMERVLHDQAGPGGTVDTQALLAQAAARWAQVFDPHALLTLQRAGERFDVRGRLGDIRCPVLFVPSRSDQIFPPDPQAHALLRQVLGERLIWREIETPYGHLASGLESAQWEPALRQLLRTSAMREGVHG